MSSLIEFNGRMNIFTNEEQLKASHLQIGQFAKLTTTGIEYQVISGSEVPPDNNCGIKLANDNLAVPLSLVIREFNTAEDLKICPNLKVGDKLRTWGKKTVADNEGDEYIVIANSVASQNPVTGDIPLLNNMTARIVARKVGQSEKITTLVVPPGTTEVETNMPNISKSPKVFLDGMLLIDGDHYTVSNQARGIITLTRSYDEPVNMVIIDTHLSASSAVNLGERYHSFTIPAGETEINCGLARLSSHPLLIVNGLHLTLGVHWNIVNRPEGIISFPYAFEKDSEAIILDNVIDGMIDASTIMGLSLRDLVKQEKTDEDAIEHTRKSKYQNNDIIMVMEPTIHFLRVSDKKGPGALEVTSGKLYLNYWFRDRNYTEPTLGELQSSTKYVLGDIVSVLGVTKAGDGQHHLRIKVKEQSSTSVTANDGSGHYWEMVPNSNISSKAESGGSTKSLKDIEELLQNLTDSIRINIIAGAGLTGGGHKGDITLSVQMAPENFYMYATDEGIVINVCNDLETDDPYSLATAAMVKKLQDEKEPKIEVKKSGFNLDKSSATNSDSEETLATSKAVKLVNDLANSKLTSGEVTEDYNTGAKIEAKIKEAKKTADEKIPLAGVTEDYNTGAKIEAKIKEAKKTADAKLTAGEVSPEYDTAKKIEDKIETLKSSSEDLKSKVVYKSQIVNNVNTTDEGFVLDGRVGKKLQDEKEPKIAVKKSGFNLDKSSATNSDSEETLATSKAVKLAYTKGEEALNKANTKLDNGGTSADYNTGKKIEDKIKANITSITNLDNTTLKKSQVVNNTTTTAEGFVLDGRVGKTLADMINAIEAGGSHTLIQTSKNFTRAYYTGTLTKNTKVISTNQILNQPILYLDGIYMDRASYDVNTDAGTITLKEVYAPKYDCIWVVEDEYAHHIKFAYPTLNLLVASDKMKSVIKVGDVIEILGESSADDGDHRLVKCESTKKLNGVDIGSGRFLNEIPNTRIKTIADKVNTLVKTFSTYVLNAMGLNIDDMIEREIDLVKYIQERGVKFEGLYYMDINTYEIYQCIKTTDIEENNPEYFTLKK